MQEVLEQQELPFIIKSHKTRKEWLLGRKGTIGGSDAACVIDNNPYRSKEKYIESLNQEVEVKDNKAMKYGRDAEDIIRKLWELDNQTKYEIFHMPNTSFVSKEQPKLLYSPDGIIIEKKTKRFGLWECKTTFARNEEDLGTWNNQIPQQYYVQILHGLIVSGFDFVKLTVKIKVYEKSTKTNYYIMKDYHIERSECTEDIEYLKKEEIKFIEQYMC